MSFLKAEWRKLAIANYEIDPVVLQKWLPYGTELDFWQEKCYVSLVGFMFLNTKLLGIKIPFHTHFEEVNLRFYVKRKDGNKIKKGVVFINETVPFKLVALLANKLYKEHYISIPTKNFINKDEYKNIQYKWKMKDKWNSITVQSDTNKYKIEPSSIEEFIFERYFGFTKISPSSTQEYRIHHPKWMTHKILNNSIDCDFGPMYGNAFASLNNQLPNSIIMAEGSEVRVNWKRTKF